ncbi:hypothetical protein PR202_gb11544 [Eleusine coracana subsp. coracana]|uniref:Vacuolar membrane protease n=1 Tax=Eleusine coracana subsp. coracana TaxID=191504 RepID=A0AAV5EMI4_ELECO|nr:hypothetical protein PR202_gb11544 [Eleusine coracana subsp. coracana]
MHVYLFREGAGDCSSCVGVMLELARGVAQWADGFKSGVLFLFNTGEEEGLDGAHSFMTQHAFLNPMLNFTQHHWRNSVRFAIDLEAMGISGKSTLFQGTDDWALESFAAVAKYPSAQIALQDVFRSGAIKSATDFQIYHEVAGLPGLDFAYTDTTSVYHTKHHWRNSVRFAIDLEAMGISGKSTLFQGTDDWALESFAADVFRSGAIKSATDFQIYHEVAGLPGLDFAYTDTTSVYHTKSNPKYLDLDILLSSAQNDKMKLLEPGSLQHIGDNMLAFLLHAAASPKFLKDAQQRKQENTEQNKAVFFDILVFQRTFIFV